MYVLVETGQLLRLLYEHQRPVVGEAFRQCYKLFFATDDPNE